MKLADIRTGEMFVIEGDKYRDSWGCRTLMKLKDPAVILIGSEQPKWQSGGEQELIVRYRVVDIYLGTTFDELGETEVIPFTGLKG